MRYVPAVRRASKSLASPRHLSTDHQGVARLQDPAFTAQFKQETPPKTFPEDSGVFSEHPLIIDTHKMVSYLRSGGFSPAQSESLTAAMVRVSQHANRHHATQMVSKNEFVSLRSELSILEKADFALLKTDINAIEKRMETSVAEIYTAVERVENRVIKWVIAVAGAIGLAILRLTPGSVLAGGGGRMAPPPPSVVSEEVDLERRKGLQILVT